MATTAYPKLFAPLKLALADSPHRPNTLVFLAICLMVTGRVEEALDPLERALRLNPNHLQGLGAMTDVLNYLGREDEAATFLRRFQALQEKG